MDRQVESNEIDFMDSEVNGTVEEWEPLAPPIHKDFKSVGKRNPKDPSVIEEPDGMVEIGHGLLPR